MLDRLCAGDAALRLEVESLLSADAGAALLFDTPLIDPVDADASEPNIGRTLGPYFIESCIGRGGMGAVYLARRADEVFERRVAIKMIRRGMDSELVIRRFRHERQILASLDHPNIASLFDGGTTPDGLPYFVMEHVSEALASITMPTRTASRLSIAFVCAFPSSTPSNTRTIVTSSIAISSRPM